jgi:DNA-binding PadR family transcriptional regulator
MEDRLRNLKPSMKKSVFKDLVFTEKHQNVVRRNTKQENVLEAILQLLITEKTGIELLQLLRARRITRFEEQEGILYTVLHELEQEGLLTSRWDERDFKYYMLNQKGLKILKKMEGKLPKHLPHLKRLLEGETL